MYLKARESEHHFSRHQSQNSGIITKLTSAPIKNGSSLDQRGSLSEYPLPPKHLKIIYNER